MKITATAYFIGCFSGYILATMSAADMPSSTYDTSYREVQLNAQLTSLNKRQAALQRQLDNIAESAPKLFSTEGLVDTDEPMHIVDFHLAEKGLKTLPSSETTIKMHQIALREYLKNR
ncbi:hypothetical protein L1286_13080 [Pseudoalteromonas sp. SMS1]|uniref:hypothetical protein n=1 Tax=Pseudoalteromonas sp. SMS1 TaxID=2908894 RepID=UPI001F292ED0|nr:hypothetical protein [Pseudoalteromonas sp. SMS1]MCF2858415.1 hypothetical protein [Pseudoalteromonas sp. SMS1]